MKRSRINIRMSDDLSEEVRRLAKAHGITVTAVIETALHHYMDPASGKAFETDIRARLDAIDLRHSAIERDLAYTLEMLGHFIFYWLTRTDPLPEGMRDAAHALGQRRYEHFLGQVARKTRTGKTLASANLDDDAH